MTDIWTSVKGLFSEATLTVVFKVVGAVVVLIIGLWLIKKLTGAIRRSKLAQKADVGLVNFLATCASIGLKVMLLLSVAGYVGIPTTSFLTLLGTIGLAIGMALQGSLSNLAGGVLLLISKPFKVGDFIESASATGTVTDIGIVYTTILTLDNRRVVIPNGSISNASVTNYSSETLRRVDLTVSAAYDSDIDDVNALLHRVALAHSCVLNEPAPFARLLEMGESALIFTLRVWCKNADYWTVYFDLTEQIKKEFDKNGITIPFPQLDMHSVNVK